MLRDEARICSPDMANTEAIKNTVKWNVSARINGIKELGGARLPKTFPALQFYLVIAGAQRENSGRFFDKAFIEKSFDLPFT